MSLQHSRADTLMQTLAKWRQYCGAETSGFCLHMFNCHFFHANSAKGHIHFCLLRESFQNIKLMSLCLLSMPASFLLFQRFPPPPPPKAPGHFAHQHFPCAFREGPCERGGSTPWSPFFSCLSGKVSFQIQHLGCFLSLLNSWSCQTDIKGGCWGCGQDTDT